MKAKKPITQKRAIKAGIFGILFGFTGIHNAMLNNRKRALAHLLSSGLAFAMFLVPLFIGFIVVYQCKHGNGCTDISGYDDTLNVILITGMILSVAAILWGIIEGIIILLKSARY